MTEIISTVITFVLSATRTRLTVVYFKCQAGDLLCDDHHGPDQEKKEGKNKLLVELLFLNQGLNLLLFSEESEKAKKSFNTGGGRRITLIFLGKPMGTVVKSLSFQWQRGLRVAVAR